MDRKLGYALILVYYYTFVIVYSLILGYTDVVMITLVITLLAYLLLLRFAKKIGTFISFDYSDLIVSIFLYSFISFYIAGMALVFSGKPVDFFRAFLMITPVTVWTFIWTDYYLQKLKGK